MSTPRPQRVLVTAAGTGIGALASVSLARDGHTVYASMRDPQGRNTDTAQNLTDGTAGAAGALSVIELDVLDEKSTLDAVEHIDREAGGLDVVVHNAAHLFVGVTEAFDAEEVLRAFDAVGALRVNRAVLPVLRRQESGLLL